MAIRSRPEDRRRSVWQSRSGFGRWPSLAPCARGRTCAAQATARIVPERYSSSNPAMVCRQTMKGGMHPAAASRQVILGVLAFAVRRKALSSRGPPLVRGPWLAQPAQLAAALGAGRVAGGQFDRHAGNMVRDRLGASVWRRGYHRAGAALRSLRRWRPRSSPAPVASARRSPVTPRTGVPGAPPTGACPALARRAFIPSIRPLDGSILLCRTVLHSRSEWPETSLRPAKVL